MLLDQYAKDR